MLKGLTSTWKNGCNAKTLTFSEYIIIDNKRIPVKAVLKDDCYNNGNFIGTFIFKEISFEVENNIDFKQKEFEYYKVVNEEAIKFGTFITTEITDNDTTELVKVVGMDFGLKTQVEYMSSLDYSSGLITLLDVWNECCELSGLTSGITDFTNSGFIVESDQFTGTGATIRDVFVAIAQSSCSFVKVMNDDKIYLIFNEATQDVVEDYTDLDDKRDTKPITCVRLGMSQIVGENLDLKDVELVKKYGEHWLIINDNPFAYTQKKREELIYAILDKIKGFGYSAFSAKTSFKPYLTCGDIIKFKNKNGELINSILLRYEHNYDEITLEAPSETSATVNYVYPANAIDLYKKAEAKVDKEANNITLLTEQTKTLRENLESDYYKKTNIDELLQTAESGITNTFSEAGGNNRFRNTGLWFTEQKTYQEEQITNVWIPNYVYCTKANDGPVYSGNGIESTFPESTEIQEEFRTKYTPAIDPSASHKYYYTNSTSRYDIVLYEVDENGKLVENPYDGGTAKFTELTYSEGKDISLSPQTKYFILHGSKNDDGTSLTLDELNEYLSSISIIETKSIEVSEEAYEFWNGKVLRKSNDRASNNNSMLLQKGTLWQEQEVPNGNYSISFWYKKLISQAVASVVINDKEYQLNSTEYKQFYTGEKDSETNEYIAEPIVVTSGHLKIEFKCDTNGGLEVYDLMANKGSVKLAYSQNENETTTETVNISKGITITSTNMETIFKANANGIRILTLQNEIIAYFTDKGLSTKELMVENKAQVCGTLISEVGDQTWFTRM